MCVDNIAIGQKVLEKLYWSQQIILSGSLYR